MSDERWERIKDVLHEAMQLHPGERAGFLDRQCAGDDAIRSEVESLLAADVAAAPGFLQTPLLECLDAELPGSIGPMMEGVLFEGRFLLVRKLGDGGMGQVWLAEQTAPVRRQVALKLIKAGMYDESVVQRFRSERQSLAIMDHPAIAKVFDAGTTAQGQPYFVMEYVPGCSITEYCDRNRLTIRERVLLLIQACDGVQHAHQKAIIHRDLKPANILVVEVDSRPAPRIIDFGLAKAVAAQAVDANPSTLIGQFVGTPGYMSPEQADFGAQDVDTRTDVYSLGVVLYVLLTGRLPFDTERGKRRPLDEMLRMLREADPPVPSARIGPDRGAIAAARGTAGHQLAALIRGDLDCITMKALERDRGRRYGTPSELAADLRRHLDHEPVLARPASIGYRLRKYARRHRVVAGVGGGLIVLIAAFSVLQSVQLQRTIHERDRANQERDRAARITDFMTAMFKVTDPSEARGNSVTAREILDSASAEMASGLARDPDVQSQMLQVMASTYANLGLYARAHDLAKRAVDARLRLRGAEDAKTLESMTQLGWILDREGDDAAAETLERRALDTERTVLGPNHALTLETMDHLAVVLEEEGRYGEAEKLAREAMEAGERTLGPESPQTLLATDHFARALWFQARYAAAEQQYRRLLDIDRRVLGADHPQTLTVLVSLALTVAQQHRVDEAERLYREVLAAQQRVLGPEHQYTVNTMDDLAGLLTNAGRLAEGEQLHRQTLEIRLRTLGAEHPDTLISQLNLADVLLKEGRVPEAERLQRGTLAVQLRVLGPENPETLVSQSNLAAIVLREGHYAEAERIAQESYDVQVRVLGQGHTDTLETLRTLGRAMAFRHRYAEASGLFQHVIEMLNSSAADNRASAWYAFACAAMAAQRNDDALRYLREAIDRGYTDADELMADGDLSGLRRDTRFLDLVGALKSASRRPI